MNHRAIVFLMLLAVLISGHFAPTASAQTKKWTQPKAPGGDPDIGGIWTSTTTTPFERPAQYGNRLYMTDEEYAALEKNMARQRNVDNESEVGPNARAGT